MTITMKSVARTLLVAIRAGTFWLPINRSKPAAAGCGQSAVSSRAVNLPTSIAVVAFGFLYAGLPSAQSQEASTGDSCLFRANEMEVYSNCVLRDGQGKLFI